MSGANTQPRIDGGAIHIAHSKALITKAVNASADVKNFIVEAKPIIMKINNHTVSFIQIDSKKGEDNRELLLRVRTGKPATADGLLMRKKDMTPYTFKFDNIIMDDGGKISKLTFMTANLAFHNDSDKPFMTRWGTGNMHVCSVENFGDVVDFIYEALRPIAFELRVAVVEDQSLVLQFVSDLMQYIVTAGLWKDDYPPVPTDHGMTAIDWLVGAASCFEDGDTAHRLQKLMKRGINMRWVQLPTFSVDAKKDDKAAVVKVNSAWQVGWIISIICNTADKPMARDKFKGKITELRDDGTVDADWSSPAAVRPDFSAVFPFDNSDPTNDLIVVSFTASAPTTTTKNFWMDESASKPNSIVTDVIPKIKLLVRGGYTRPQVREELTTYFGAKHCVMLKEAFHVLARNAITKLVGELDKVTISITRTTEPDDEDVRNATEAEYELRCVILESQGKVDVEFVRKGIRKLANKKNDEFDSLAAEAPLIKGRGRGKADETKQDATRFGRHVQQGICNWCSENFGEKKLSWPEHKRICPKKRY